MRQETATEPSTGSIPEFSKSERAGPVRLPVADEQHDRSCPMRSWSPRSYARRDLRPCERADVIAVKRSAQARRRKPRKRKSQQMRVRDLLNARTGSLRCEFLTAGRSLQLFFRKSRWRFGGFSGLVSPQMKRVGENYVAEQIVPRTIVDVKRGVNWMSGVPS